MGFWTDANTWGGFALGLISSGIGWGIDHYYRHSDKQEAKEEKAKQAQEAARNRFVELYSKWCATRGYPGGEGSRMQAMIDSGILDIESDVEIDRAIREVGLRYPAYCFESVDDSYAKERGYRVFLNRFLEEKKTNPAWRDLKCEDVHWLFAEDEIGALIEEDRKASGD